MRMLLVMFGWWLLCAFRVKKAVSKLFKMLLFRQRCAAVEVSSCTCRPSSTHRDSLWSLKLTLGAWIGTWKKKKKQKKNNKKKEMNNNE